MNWNQRAQRRRFVLVCAITFAVSLGPLLWLAHMRRESRRPPQAVRTVEVFRFRPPCVVEGRGGLIPINGCHYIFGPPRHEPGTKCDGHLWGLALSDGRILVPPIYDDVNGFREGRATVVRGDAVGFIDVHGREVIPPQFDLTANRYSAQFHEGLANINVDGKEGFIDLAGRFAIAPQFSSAGSFSEGLCRVSQGEDEARRWGYIDRAGNVVIPFRFRGTASFQMGLAPAYEEELWGYIDTNGKFVIPPSFGSVDSFKEGMALVAKDTFGPRGVIDKTGRLVAPIVYATNSSSYEAGRLAVRRKDEWGFLDTQGNEIIACQYRCADDFREGLAAVRLWKTGKWAVIDRDGKTVIEARFDHIMPFNQGLAPANIGGVPSDVEARPTLGGKWGFIDTSGKLVLPAIHDRAFAFGDNGIAKVWSGWDAHFIDRKGRKVDYIFWRNDDDSAIVPASLFDHLPENTPRLSPSPAELMAMQPPSGDDLPAPIDTGALPTAENDAASKARTEAASSPGGGAAWGAGARRRIQYGRRTIGHRFDLEDTDTAIAVIRSAAAEHPPRFTGRDAAGWLEYWRTAEGDIMSEPQADALMWAYVGIARNEIRQLWLGEDLWDDLPGRAKEVLILLHYDMGIGNEDRGLWSFVGLKAALQAGDFITAGWEIWDSADGRNYDPARNTPEVQERRYRQSISMQKIDPRYEATMARRETKPNVITPTDEAATD